MRFSLRTLLIVVTFAACFMGVARWWRGHRQFCLSRAEYHDARTVLIGGFSLPNMTKEESDRIIREAMAELERKGAEHERLAAAYRKAVWQPWLRLTIDETQEPEE
jgi:hypothetical protein